MPFVIASQAYPEDVYHYTSTIQTLFQLDPVAFGDALSLPVAVLREQVRRYHREKIRGDQGPANQLIREAYAAHLAFNLIGQVAPGYPFSLN